MAIISSMVVINSSVTIYNMVIINSTEPNLVTSTGGKTISSSMGGRTISSSMVGRTISREIINKSVTISRLAAISNIIILHTSIQVQCKDGNKTKVNWKHNQQ